MMAALGPSRLLLRLQGLVCLYKPANVEVGQLCRELKLRILSHIRTIGRSSSPIVPVVVRHPETGALTVQEEERPVHELALVHGHPVTKRDMEVVAVNPLCSFSSGVQLVGVNKLGFAMGRAMRDAQLMRTYRVRGRLGRCTADGTPDSPTKLRATWGHVNQMQMDRLCSVVQSQYQKKMFEFAGVNAQSHEAFLLASQGLVRPRRRPEEKIPFVEPTPMIYGLRCVEFAPPNFDLEIHCVYETSRFLRLLVRDLGLELHSAAHCRAIRRVRHGRLVAGPQSMLLSQFSLQALLDNIEYCDSVHPLSSLHFHVDKFEPVSDVQLLSE